ncbi:MAG: hypothetical protein JXR79_09205 [Nitrospirae bacterium]|nr:hypothetical protein [Nitrospirota bacterium]
MKILHILKSEPDNTTIRIIEMQKKAAKVEVVALKERSADELIQMIEAHDKIIMW